RTEKYNVNLSKLEGTFRLNSETGVQAAKPETVVVENARGVMNLARIEDQDPSTLDEHVDKAMQNAALVENEEPVPPPPVPVPTPVRVRPVAPVVPVIPTPPPLAIAALPPPPPPPPVEEEPLD